jgi:hypothetical protein
MTKKQIAAINEVLFNFKGSKLIGIGEKSMSTEYKNSGTVSANQKKRPGKKDPDIAGSLDSVVCPHCGKEADFWLNGWRKETDKAKFYSLSVRPKVAKASEAKATEHVDNEDIPF